MTASPDTVTFGFFLTAEAAAAWARTAGVTARVTSIAGDGATTMPFTVEVSADQCDRLREVLS